VRVHHYGHAIVGFENALDVTEEQVSGFISNLESLSDLDSMHTNEETGAITNSGGYEFFPEAVNTQPTRYQDLHYPGISDVDASFVDSIDETLSKCLLGYLDLFPAANDCVQWRTNGHIAKYEPGQSIGPHSDNTIPRNEPSRLAPLMNTLTAGVFLNGNYVGGNLYFRQWNITPKTPALSAIIYPSAFSGCHEVTEVTSGVRHTFLCWYGQGPYGGYQTSIPKIVRESKIREIPEGHIGDV